MRTLFVLAAVSLSAFSSVGSIPETTWRPSDPYWEAYRAVIVQVDCDSTGRVERAKTLYSPASPAETDSILNLARQQSFDPKTSDGLVRRGKYDRRPGDPDLQFIVPYVTHNRTGMGHPATVTRKELEGAGLGPWLAIWDRLLPEWPVETWSYTTTTSFYEYSSTMIDSQMVSLGMVSLSPDKRWHLHPFVGVEFSDGRPDFDVDGGFALYTTGDSTRVRQHVTGTPVNYASAEWIDEDRFVVTALHVMDLDYQNQVTFYHAPLLCLGNVHSPKITCLFGPPISIQDGNKVWEELDKYGKARYPKFSALVH